MSVRLPDGLRVLERGWLSANNILFLDGPTATLVDSGYVTHAEQTVALVRHALDGRPLGHLVNTHGHSDHIGGNAAVQAAFGCALVLPAGLSDVVHAWDEEALLLTPLGQQAAPFRHNATLAAGDTVRLGDADWQCLAAPGHDMDALVYYQPEQRLLISGDALWENGFGVLFPELLGQADGLASARQTLEALGRLSIDTVIPGHGAPFADVDAALTRAFKRLDGFVQDMERLVWHALKVIVVFILLDKRRLTRDEAPGFIHGLPFVDNLNARYLGLPPDALAERLIKELVGSGALRLEDGWLLA